MFPRTENAYKTSIDLFPRTNKKKNTVQTSRWAYRSTQKP